MDLSCITCRLGLTRLSAFGGTLKGKPDKMAVGSMGRAVRLLVVVVVVALHPAEVAGWQVRLEAGMAGVVALAAGMAGTVALPLVEMTEAGEEGARPRGVPGMPQSLDGRTLQQGQIEPLLVRVHDEVLTVMTVRLDHVLNSSFLLSILCYSSTSIRTLGCCFSASSRHCPTAWSHSPTSTTTTTSCTADGTTTGAWSWP